MSPPPPPSYKVCGNTLCCVSEGGFHFTEFTDRNLMNKLMRSPIKKLTRIYYMRESKKHREMEGGVEGWKGGRTDIRVFNWSEWINCCTFLDVKIYN